MRKRIHAAALAGLILAVVLAAPAAAAQDDLQNKVDAAQQEYNSAAGALAAQQAEEAEIRSQVDELEGQAGAVQEQLRQVYAGLTEAQAALAAAQNEAAQAETDLLAKQREYDDCRAGCRQMLRAMQRLDDGGSLSVLSSATGLYELLTFTKVLGQMTARYQQSLAELDAEAQALADRKRTADEAAARAEEARAALESQQTRLDATQNELAQALADANEALSAEQAQTQAAEVLTEEKRRALEQAEQEFDAYVKAQAAGGAGLTCGLDFGPVISGGYISCQWGGTDYLGRPHWATDIAAAGGTPIYAAADGVVSVATAHWSYGNYVLLNHGTGSDGRTYATLYAHMRSYTVSPGETVAKGQLIGYVGNTGNVTGKYGGYHLHLELRINGDRTVASPMQYIPR